MPILSLMSIFVPTTPEQLGRLATLPQNVYAAGVATGFVDDRLREVAGLPWSALTGLVSFGRVPEEGRVFTLDAAAMAGADPGGALDAAGFARADPETGPVYWVLADGEAAFELNTVFRPNPLLPDIPVAIRVAPLEDRIALYDPATGELIAERPVEGGLSDVIVTTAGMFVLTQDGALTVIR